MFFSQVATAAEAMVAAVVAMAEEAAMEASKAATAEATAAAKATVEATGMHHDEADFLVPSDNSSGAKAAVEDTASRADSKVARVRPGSNLPRRVHC